MRFYAAEDCLSFRLVLNAIECLGLFADERPVREAIADAPARERLAASLRGLRDAWSAAAPHVPGERLSKEDPALAKLVGADMQRLLRQWEEHAGRIERAACEDSARFDADLCEGLATLFADAANSLPAVADMPLAQGLTTLEIPVRVAAAAARVIECDSVLEELCEGEPV